MEVALLPRFQQVGIWTKAVSTVFREEDLDQQAFKTINDWHKEVAELIKRRNKLSNDKELEAWQRDIGQLINTGTTLRKTPLSPPKDGKPLVVSVRGLVNQPGKISGQPGLTLKQAIAKAGGVFTLGSNSNVELYRKIVPEELSKIKGMIGEERFASGKFELATKLFDKLITDEKLEEFLTLAAYEHLG